MKKNTGGSDDIPSLASDPTAVNMIQPLALHLIGLCQSFHQNKAVDHLDLNVPVGSFFGLVGPNGAGKTTTLLMAVGLLRPDAGTAYVFGIDIWKEPIQAKRLMGVSPDGLSMFERLTGREMLVYLGLLRGMDANVVTQRTDELLTVLDLANTKHTLIIDYSTGMRKKIALAAALLHRPKLLVLDEPLEAVDPVSSATIKELLQRFVRAGGTVIFSSHVMAVVEQVCDHVAVVASGRVIASGPLEKVRNGLSLEERFVALVGHRLASEKELSWLVS